jgi:hypothetical protein
MDIVIVFESNFILKINFYKIIKIFLEKGV